eukprot:gene15897-7229_t
MDAFKLLLPKEKKVDCLEDLGALTIKELKHILLYEYLVIRTSKFKHILLKSTAYKKLKAFQFFFEGFIKKIDVAKNKEFTFFNVRVKASMKKVLYKVILKHSNISGDVCSAACSCPAGIGLGGFANCDHVGGVLFALEDFNWRGLQGFESAVSCTSKLSSWNVPNASSLRSFNPAPIDEVVIKKIKFRRNYDGYDVPKSKTFEPRITSHRTVKINDLEILKSKLTKFMPNSGFFGFYPASTSDFSPSSDSAFTSATDTQDPSLAEAVSFNECFDISKQSFKDMMDIYCHNLSLSAEEISDIEKDALKDKKFFLENNGGTIKLKCKHQYYYQVQGQMFCADLKRIDFVVWFGGSEPLFVEYIWSINTI